MGFGMELYERWRREAEAYRRLHPEPIRFYVKDGSEEREVTREEFFAEREKSVKYTMSINTTHTFGESELATVAYALGKSDRDPKHVTEEEIGEFILDALIRRVQEVNRHAESA